MSNMRSNSSSQCEFNSLIKVLRSIVMSRKQPCSILAVMKDYYELENHQLPYNKFGCKSPMDLFLQSGEFYVRAMAGETFLTAKPNNKSDHIADLVRQQKSSRHVTRITKPANVQRRLSRHVQNRPIHNSASQSLGYSGNRQQKVPIQHPYLQEEKQYQNLKDQLQLQLQNELEKQKQQLLLNFEKEKENLKKTFLIELTKNGANNNFSQSVKKNVEITDQLKKLNERINQLESKPNVTKDSFLALELEEHRRMTAEVKKLTEHLSELKLDSENYKPFHNKMLSPEKQQNKEKSKQATTEKSPKKQIKESETKSQAKQSQHVATTTNSKSRVQGPPTQRVSSSDNNPGLQPTDLRHRLNAMRSQKQTEKPISNVIATDATQNESQKLRPILGQQNAVGNQQVISSNHNISNFNNNKMSKNPQQKSQQPRQHSQPQSVKQSEIMEPRNVPQKHFNVPLQQDSFKQQQRQPSQCFPKQPSVQNRLKLNVNCDKNFENGNHSVKSETASQAESIKSETQKIKQSAHKPNNSSISTNRKIWKFDPKLDPCTSIALYCTAKKYGEPKYNVFRSKQGLYDCELIINTNTIYSTYPQEYTTEAMARFSCAEKAIQQIQIVEARNLLPTFPDDKEFLKVLYNELLLHPNGIISDKMSEWFVDKFGFTMPEHWFILIKNSARFIIEDSIRENTFIILANKDAENDNQLALDAAVPIQMEPLKLPWLEKTWELYFTHCVSTAENWGCLLGDEYNNRYEKLTSELNSHMSKEKVRPDVIAPNHIYLVELNSNWHRVRVESLDKEKQKVFCFYIDFGDTANLSVNELYLCDAKFLWLPPQAIPFSLFGLEDLAGNPYAIKELEKRLLNRAVIGEILSKEADFQANGIIEAVLFDTSTDEDINLNLLLKDEICKQSQPPQLKAQGITSVNVTNIDSNNGDVSLQILNDDFEYVQKTLKQIVESKFNREQLKCSAEELLRQQLLLIHDEDHSVGWFRAKIIDIDQAKNLVNGREQMVDVLYIDYNIKRRVHMSEIYRLESLSKALSTFLPQAIRVKLHNIPEFNQTIIGRMRALLPQNCQAFVRVEIPGDVPHVTILRKVNGPDMPYCNINDDLSLEIERLKDATLCSKDSSNGSASSSKSEALHSPTQLFRSLTLTSTPMLPLKISELPKLREYDIKLPLNSLFYVNVILVSNPLSFTVHPYNDDFQRLLNMMKELQDYCQNNDAYIPVDMVKIGQAYAAKKGQDYYRVIAKAQYGDVINVCFCDYGDSGTVRSDHLKVLPAQFRQLPKMGINARLYGIKGNSDDVWSTDDVQRFRDLVLGKKMASFFKGTRRDEKDTLEISLDLVDVEGEEDINIRQILLDERRAIPTAAEK